MLEFYQAYTDYHGIMNLTQEVDHRSRERRHRRDEIKVGRSGNRLGQLAAHDHARSHHPLSGPQPPEPSPR